jgi:hypothetical protein
MKSEKKKQDNDFAGTTLVGRASINADLKAVHERQKQKLADDVWYSKDMIDHIVIPSKHARDIAWREAVRERDEIRAAQNPVFGVVCIACVALTVVGTKFALPMGLNPVIALSTCVFALSLALAFFAVVYDYVCRGGCLSAITGVLSSPVTGFYPWMGDRVALAANNAWGIGGEGLYVPRYPRDEYEPYHNVVAYAVITDVEVSVGTGTKERPYPAHLLIRTAQRPSGDYVFEDASTEDGLSAVELAQIIKAKIEAQK